VDIKSIDPDIFWDEDGKTYFVTQGDEGIRVTEIDLKTGGVLAPERLVWGGMGGRYPEAPHMYRKDGYYYLLLGEGGTEYAHSATIGRSRHIYGPYEPCPLNPIISHSKRIAQGNQIQGTGHADFVRASDGSWWVVFLGFRVTQPGSYYHVLGRETFLAPVDWPDGGWPQVNGNGTVSLDMKTPTLPQYPLEAATVRTDFDSDKPGLEWNYLRNPVRENYSLTEKKGCLRITASPSTLDEAAQLSFLGRRQTEHSFTATTSLDFHPMTGDEEAGITLIQNNTHHYDLMLTREGDNNVIRLRARLGSLSYTVAERTVAGTKARLRIEGSPLKYSFSFADPDKGEYTEIGSLDTRYLSTEVAGGFTGVMIGMYASSNGKPTASKAYYDWFDYQTEEKER
jgi:alpha-N-arabinofuranosidase